MSDPLGLRGGLAVQVSVDVGGHVWSDSFGTDIWGGPCTPTTLHNVFCASKPMLFVVLLNALDERDVPLDVSARELVSSEDRPWVPDVRMSDLLSHTAGLVEPSILAWRLTVPDERLALLRSTAVGPPGPSYSEVMAGLISEAVLRCQCRWTDVARAFQADVLPAWGLRDSYMSLDDAGCAGLEERISASVFMADDRRVPFLGEMETANLRQVSPALGCYTTAVDLCRFYRLVMRCMRGEEVAYMPRPSAFEAMQWGHVRSTEDARLRRSSRFSLGFMVDLRERFGGGRLSERTFGHTGGYCTSVGFADRASDVVGGVIVGQYLPDQVEYDDVLSRVVGYALERTS